MNTNTKQKVLVGAGFVGLLCLIGGSVALALLLNRRNDAVRIHPATPPAS